MQILHAAADDHGHVIIHTVDRGTLLLTRAHIESAHDRPPQALDGYTRSANVAVCMASGQAWRFTGESGVLTDLTKAIQYGKVQDAS
jgi:hypothetical protein